MQDNQQQTGVIYPMNSREPLLQQQSSGFESKMIPSSFEHQEMKKETSIIANSTSAQSPAPIGVKITESPFKKMMEIIGMDKKISFGGWVSAILIFILTLPLTLAFIICAFVFFCCFIPFSLVSILLFILFIIALIISLSPIIATYYFFACIEGRYKKKNQLNPSINKISNV